MSRNPKTRHPDGVESITGCGGTSGSPGRTVPTFPIGSSSLRLPNGFGSTSGSSAACRVSEVARPHTVITVYGVASGRPDAVPGIGFASRDRGATHGQVRQRG